MSSAHCYIGVATPQANPTVEVEFQQFYRGPARAVFTRLTSSAEAPADRLINYIEQVSDALASFDTLPLRAFAFACTASSYLVGHDREEQLLQQAEQQFGIQVVSATQAIRRELEGHGVRRIALFMPYPDSLCRAAVDYWSALGFDVVAQKRIDTGPDTRAIYAIDDQQVADTLCDFDDRGADVVLLSGTGMPTISALLESRRPMLSSNLCLATEMLRRTQNWPPREAANIRQLIGAQQ
ncbi:MAG: hypothetical protein K0U72_15920 [Gammaproteobacteria bacterium]|nr:hypothetical protein [Gammaproteobacteria bacterium]